MSSIPNSYIDDLRSIVLATLNRIEQLRMRVLFGVQFVKGAYGQELEFRSNGYSYIDGVLITGGGTGDFMADGSVPMTGDLDMNDNNLANCNTVNGRIDAILQITSNYQTLRLNAEAGYDIVMGDPVAMGSNKITGLAAATANGNALRYEQLIGAYLPIGGGTLTGATEAADHGAAATDQIINVCYGTSATPPTANTTTIGTLYIQYTA